MPVTPTVRGLNDTAVFPALTGAGTAAGDLFLIYDVSVGALKTVTRAELKAAISAQATIAPSDLQTALRVGVILGGKATVDMNSTADQPIPIVSPTPTYWVNGVVCLNPSKSFGTGTAPLGGIYTAASKSGGVLVSASQSYAALTATTKNTVGGVLSLPQNAMLHDYVADPNLYFSLSTPHGAAGTMDVHVFIRPIY